MPRRRRKSSSRRATYSREVAKYRARGPGGRFAAGALSPEQRTRARFSVAVQELKKFRKRGAGGRFRSGDWEIRGSGPSGEAEALGINHVSGENFISNFFRADSDTIHNALAAGAEVVAREAREIAPSPGADHPYSLGNLVNSIQVQETDEGTFSVVAIGGSPSWVTKEPRIYGGYVEKGGRTPGGKPTPARRFLEQAAHSTRSEQLEAIVDSIRQEMIG